MIVALIALPIAGMTAFSVVMWSTMATPEEKVQAELGEMQAWVQPIGVPDSGFWQAPTEPTWNGYPSESDGRIVEPVGEPLADPTIAFPSGVEAIRTVEGQVRTNTAKGVAPLRAWAGDAWDARFAGRFDLIDGRVPAASGEALVSPAALKRIGISIGDEITLADSDDAFTVVGTMRAAYAASDQSVLFLPPGAPVTGTTKWFLPEHALAWADVQKLNEQGIVVYSRAVVLDPPAASSAADPWGNVYDQYTGAMWSLIAVLATAAVFAAYVVVMLAGAAFSVAARRQQRSLAVAASVGAAPADLRRTIVLQGTVLGLIGGGVGLLLGVGVSALIMSLTDDGSGTRYWGFHVPWAALAAILVFSVLVGTAAAAVPARTVARTDTLSALRGARRPQMPRTSRPVWGSIILVVGVGLTIASALATTALQVVSQEEIAWDSPLRAIPPFGIVIGPILVQLGILLSGRWLLWLASRVLSRLSLAARVATRDAAANASRTVPAFAAIGATVFIAVFALSQTSMQNASSARNWYYQAPVGALTVEYYPGGTGMVSALTADQNASAAESGVAIATAAGASSTVVIHRPSEQWSFSSVSDVPEDLLWVMALMPEDELLDPSKGMTFSTGQDLTISVIPSDGLSTAIGAEITAAQLNAYRDGSALVTDERWVTDGAIDVATWTARDAYEGKVPSNIWAPGPEMPAIAEPLREEKLDAVLIDLPHQPTSIAISPETADRLGMVTEPAKMIASFAEPLTDDDMDRIRSHAELFSTPDVVLAPYYERGPTEDAFWMIPVLAGVGVLVLAASAVALGLARFERRPDDATLTAIGGTPGLRRRIEFWQGLVIAGFGTITGTAAGILPPIGFAIQSQGQLLISDIPWLALAGFAIALPLLIAVASWLIPPRTPDLTRRTVIA